MINDLIKLVNKHDCEVRKHTIEKVVEMINAEIDLAILEHEYNYIKSLERFKKNLEGVEN